MRRRVKQGIKQGVKGFNDLFHKPSDHSRSPSPAPSHSGPKPSAAVNVTTTSTNYLQEGLSALQHSLHMIQHEELKQSFGDLLIVTEAINQSSNQRVLVKLNGELKQLAEIPQNLGESSQVEKCVQDLASDISTAAKNAQAQFVRGSTKQEVNDQATISTLRDALHQAVSKFRTESVATTSTSDIKGKGRAISGRIVGALTIVEKSLDGIPVPGPKAVVGGLLEILKSINLLLDNEDDLKGLVDHLQRLVKVVTPPEGSSIDPDDADLAQRLEELTSDMKRVKTEAEKIRDQNKGSKFFGSADNAAAIAKLSKITEQAIDRFQTAGGIQVERRIRELRGGIERVEEKVLSAAPIGKCAL
ncbi:hypothetical protein FRC02_009513 [Tulasnella sp. 418]|nr:hypothetical protein FRC02_009513 [Tulasnella sp. 418]